MRPCTRDGAATSNEQPVLGPTIAAVASAALFGSGAPASKALLGEIDPRWLAGLLYLGSAIALGGAMSLRGRRVWASGGLHRRDLPWLAGAIVVGGVIAPLLLLWGLSRTTASSASLLLALEAPLTAVWARWLFREHLGARMIQGLALITFAAAATVAPGAGAIDPGGCVAVVLACTGWALDNNMTREVAHADAMTIAAIKGLVGGAVNVSLAVAVGALRPSAMAALSAGIVGAFAYGLSLALYVVALRGLGAARASAYFATAPFVGALVGVAVLGEPATARLALAALLVTLGVHRLARELHRHRHGHDSVEHFHSHVHDEHHHHLHRGEEGPEPHGHRHRHEPLEHAHAHTPDLHHRHGHE